MNDKTRKREAEIKSLESKCVEQESKRERGCKGARENQLSEAAEAAASFSQVLKNS